jgi:thioredoxin 1
MSFKNVRIAPFMLSMLMILSLGTGCNSGSTDSTTTVVNTADTGAVKGNAIAAEGLKVTFVELGSVNCIPCRMMKPVMEKIEQQYKGQVKVVFHDVWTPEGKTSGAKYAIRVIPTQVFLDKDGNEYYRHEGFFPFEEVDKILKQKGVK